MQKDVKVNIIWKNVARDVGVIFLLTLAGGILTGLAGFPVDSYPAAAVNTAMTFGGFLLSGYWVRADRLKHLHCVALMTWLLEFFGVVDGAGLLAWAWQIIVIYALMIAAWKVADIFFSSRDASLFSGEGPLPGIARDVILIFMMTYLGGVALRGLGGDILPYALIGLSFFLIFIGFFLSAYWAEEKNRLRHLVYVAFFVWIVNAINLTLGGTVGAWLFGIVINYALMLAAYGAYKAAQKIRA